MTLTCPYCEKDFIKDEDRKYPHVVYDSECNHCEKSFAYTIEINITTDSYEAECLNGGEHEWEIPYCYPEFASRRVCKCGLSEDVYTGKDRQDMADAYFKAIKRDL
jgi:hypothetical protein